MPMPMQQCWLQQHQDADPPETASIFVFRPVQHDQGQFGLTLLIVLCCRDLRLLDHSAASAEAPLSAMPALLQC